MRKNHVVLIGTAFMAAIAASLVCTSCEKLEFWKNGPKIGFNVTAQGTKATAYTTSGLNTTGQSFNMIAVADDDWVDNETNVTTDAGEYFKSVVKYNGSTWDTYDSAGSSKTTWNWLNGVSIHFWSYYPISLGTTGASRVITTPVANSNDLYFTYSLPTPTPIAPATSHTDATNQIDIIFAGNKETRAFDEKTGEITTVTSSYNSETDPLTPAGNEYFNIRFHHALSEIKFAVSLTDHTFDKNLVIKNIRISNVSSSGKCKFTLPSTFVWSDYGAAKSYSQDMSADFSSSTPSTWPLNSTNGLNVYNNSFFMIPQELASSSVDITFERDGDEITKSVPLATADTTDGDDEWEPGKYYTYKIQATIDIDVSLSLSVSSWDYDEESFDYENACTLATGGKLAISNPAGSSKISVADSGPVLATFRLSSPIGATWFASVTNTSAFEIYTLDEANNTNPAFGTIKEGGSPVAPLTCSFYIKAKPGVDRSVLQQTKVNVTVRFPDGTYHSINDLIEADLWTIILNPVK